jgi:hypothetical protein
MEPVVDGLTMMKENMIILKAPIDNLLSVGWDHGVDFKTVHIQFRVCLYGLTFCYQHLQHNYSSTATKIL